MTTTDGGTLLRRYMRTRARAIGRPGTELEYPSDSIGAAAFAQKINAYWRKQKPSEREIAKVGTIERHAAEGHTGVIGGDSWWLVVAAFLLDLTQVEADELFKAKGCPTIAELQIRHDNDPKKSTLLNNWLTPKPDAGGVLAEPSNPKEAPPLTEPSIQATDLSPTKGGELVPVPTPNKTAEDEPEQPSDPTSSQEPVAEEPTNDNPSSGNPDPAPTNSGNTTNSNNTTVGSQSGPIANDQATQINVDSGGGLKVLALVAVVAIVLGVSGLIALNNSSNNPDDPDPAAPDSASTSATNMSAQDFCVVGLRSFDDGPNRKLAPVSDDPACKNIEVRVLQANIEWSTEIDFCNINQHHDEIEVVIVVDETQYPMSPDWPGLTRPSAAQTFEEVWLKVPDGFESFDDPFLGSCKATENSLNFRWHPTDDALEGSPTTTTTASVPGSTSTGGEESAGSGAHSDLVTAVAWSPDGQFFATGSRDQTVTVWDANGSPVRTLPEMEGEVRHVEWSPDGTHFFVTGYFNDALVWETDSWTEPRTFSCFGCKFAWLEDGEQFISSGGGDMLRIWELEGLALDRKIPIETAIGWSLVVSQDGQTLISGANDGFARIWEMGDLTDPPRTSATANTRAVTTVAWSPEGDRFASGGYNKTVKFWDRETGQPAGDEVAVPGNTFKLFWLTSQDLILVIGSPQLVVLEGDDESNYQIRETVQGREGISLSSGAVNPAETTLVTGDGEGGLLLWDLTQPNQISKRELPN